MRNDIKEICGIKTTNKIKYLGMEINDNKDLFKAYVLCNL